MTRDRYTISQKNRYSPDHIRYPSSLRKRADQTFGPYQNKNNSQQLNRTQIISGEQAPSTYLARRRRIISVEPAQQKQTPRRRIISVEPAQQRQTPRRRRIISVEPAQQKQTTRRRRIISVEPVQQKQTTRRRRIISVEPAQKK
tara:strand:- start:51 stop:482 length:432 start_codon:yes stop_codon:yes gene_type:complete